MRGLTLFIADIRKCRGKEEEIKRINKELANIRNKFKGDKTLNGYHKKKYVCKLLFMFLLGHRCDFGFMEAVNLLSSNAYSEKQIGYLFISVLMRGDHEFIPLIINCLRSDLSSGNKTFQNLALQFIANSPNEDIADSLSDIVLELLLSNETADFVKQTAALTLLQLLRIRSDLFFDACKTNRIMNLISCHNLGLLTASISLIDFLSKRSPLRYEACLPQCIARLDKIVSSPYLDYQDYTYYEIAAPWLTVKLLRLMQNFSAPTEFALKTRLRNSLDTILNRTEESAKPKKFEHNNTKYAIVFEAISLIMHMDLDAPLLYKAISTLGNILKYRDVNLRFMALDMMTRLTDNEVYLGNIRMYWQSILDALSNERDITVKKQAIDLLYNICDKNNAKCIVKGMLIFIQTEPESAHNAILKAAALAEKFNSDLKWYVDTVFTSLQICKNFIEEGIWYTLVRVIATNDDIQEYAAELAYTALLQPDCHDIIIKVAGHILGEYGYLISKHPRSNQTKQLSILREKYVICTNTTRSLLLTTFMKFLNVYPELKEEIQSIFRDKINVESSNLEVQQRAVEYYKLSQIASKTLMSTVFEEIPPCSKRESTVFKAIERRKSCIFNTEDVEKTIRKNIPPSYSTTNLCSILPDSKIRPISKSISNPHLQMSSNPSSNVKLLLEAFRETPTMSANPMPLLVPQKTDFAANENFLHNLLFNEKGVLFENDIIRILIQCDFNKNFGRFHMTYHNRSSKILSNFTAKGDFACTEDKCSIWFQPSSTVLGIEGYVEQDIHLECLSEFLDRPSLTLNFLMDETVRQIKVILPLTVNKFSEPVAMSAQDYMKRWTNIGLLGQDVVKKIRSKYPMIRGVLQMKLMGFRVSVIEHVSPDPNQIHCAGVFYTRSQRTGFLFRLTAIPEEIGYQVIVRSNQRSLSENISDLLFSLL